MKTPHERRLSVSNRSKLSAKKQSNLLSVNRSGLYYKAKPETELNLALMKLIDEHHQKHPNYGIKRMHQWLRKDKGFEIKQKPVG